MHHDTPDTDTPARAQDAREPAFRIMQQVVERVPELAGYRFIGNRVLFRLREPTVIEGREVDEIAIRNVNEYAWMRVSDIDFGVKLIRDILQATPARR